MLHGVPHRDGPVAVVRDGIVLDLNPIARQRGISVGMESRTARAIAHEIEILQWEADPFREEQERWLELCTEFTGIIEPDDQHSTYLDLSGHPNPTDVAEKLVRTLVAKTGLAVRYGAARSKWLAQLSSDVGDCGVAIRDPREFLTSLSVSRLTPLQPETRERLIFLGYRTVGQLFDIPPEILRQQFGQESLLIERAAKGELTDAVLPVYPKDSIIESLIFEGPVELLETLDQAFKDLAQRVGIRLAERSLQGQELEVSLELEERQKHLKRRFSKPIHNPLSALASLKLILERAIDEPVVAIRLRLRNLQPNKEKQKALLGPGKAMDPAAFHYVRSVFGDKAVQLGSEIAVPRRVRVLREWKNALGWS